MKRALNLLLCFIVIFTCLRPVPEGRAESAADSLKNLYTQAELQMTLGNYSEAADLFDKLGPYGDASQMAMYAKALMAAETLGMYDMAVQAFRGLGDFKDSQQMTVYYTARGHEAAADALNRENASDSDLETALFAYQEAEKDYASLALFKDCLSRCASCREKETAVQGTLNERENAKKEKIYQRALALENEGKYEEAIKAYSGIVGYKDAEQRIDACQARINEGIYLSAQAQELLNNWDEAIRLYRKIKDYKDSAERIAACEQAKKVEADEAVYQSALTLEKNMQYQEAIKTYHTILSYKDSKERIVACENSIKEGVYQEAKAFENAKDCLRAITLYRTIKEYKDSADRIASIYSAIFLNPSGKRASDYPLYLGFTLDMRHKAFLEVAGKNGFTTKWINNGLAFQDDSWGYKYWERNCKTSELGDFAVQAVFRNDEATMTDDDPLLCLEYDFGTYGTKDSQTIEEAKKRYETLDAWLIRNYGQPLAHGVENIGMLSLPDRYHYARTGLEYMTADLPCSLWIIPLQNGSMISITNVIDKQIGIQNQLYFVLYDAGAVSDLLNQLISK